MTELPRSFRPSSRPTSEAAAAALARQDTLTKPPGALGRLEDLSVWVAACQGVCPPRQFERPRVVVFAGDHGVTAAGVSAFPAEVTAQMVANFDDGRRGDQRAGRTRRARACGWSTSRSTPMRR